MATSTIKDLKTVTTVNGSGTGTIATAGGFANVAVDFTPPANGTLIATVLTYISASNSVNNVTVCEPTAETSTSTTYRVVCSTAQSVTIQARRIYLV